MSRDLYFDREARLDTVVGDGNGYWLRLSRAANEWAAIGKDGFNDWLETNYGFRAIYDEDGGITGRPDILDDQKYLVFLLKYGG